MVQFFDRSPIVKKTNSIINVMYAGERCVAESGQDDLSRPLYLIRIMPAEGAVYKAHAFRHVLFSSKYNAVIFFLGGAKVT